ncbi:MAG TPA: hypothetical protein VF739_01860, partial [Ktedonobacterales bacterium]
MARISLPIQVDEKIAQTAERPASTAARVPLTRVYSALALGLVCISFSAIFTRLAQTPGTVSAVYRVGIAAVLLAPLFVRNMSRGKVVLGWRIWLLAAAAGAFFV